MKRTLIMIICLAGISMAEQEPPISHVPGSSISVDSLPATVKAPEGKLTLYADYADKRPGGVVLYLVNRTKEGVELDSQDNDIYIKLECKNQDGTWVRAQTHFYSWCGNSYTVIPKIEPGDFVRLLGYEPAEGKEREVRFKRYAKTYALVSNVGRLKVSDKDVKAAAEDRMAINFGDLDFVKKVATGEIKLPKNENELMDLRTAAIFHLADPEFDSKEVMPLLKSLAKDEESGLAVSINHAIKRIQKREAQK